tara:strand:- start:12 stop:458 length:447 start_codon:yes stop_codon:yes gene_type:complete
MEIIQTMIRQYQSDDTDALASIWWSASVLAHPFLSNGFMAQEDENLRNLYLPNAETWVLEQTEKPVGFIALIDAEIGGLFLCPSCHGQGLGKMLVDHAANLKGPLSVEVFERNHIGRRFYDRYGFSETGRYRHEASREITLRMTMPSV